MTAGLIGGMTIGALLTYLATQPAPSADTIEKLRQDKPEFYKVIDLDVSEERGKDLGNDEQPFQGNFIWIDNQYATCSEATIKINEREFSSLDLLRQKFIRGPFYRFFISNTVGTGTIRLIISRGYEFASEPIEGVMRVVGEDGTALAVDTDGYLTAIMKGIFDSALQTLATDEDGRIAALLYGLYSGSPVAIAVDASGHLLLASLSQGNVEADTTEAQTWDATLSSLRNNLNRIRYAIVTITGEAWGTISNSIADVWAKFHATTGHKHAGTTGDAPKVTHSDLASIGVDDHHAQVHDLGSSDHNADTLANLNTKVSDATLLDEGDIIVWAVVFGG